MAFYTKITKIFNKIKSIYIHSSNERYVNYLRSKGVLVGGGTKFRPHTTEIDLTRPSLVTIGNDCYFNEHFTILTHDYVSRVFINSGREFLPSSGKVIIGNNVSTGYNVMILKGVSIGDNVFIGANSLVTKDIPSDSIVSGSPARVICTLGEFYEKRKVQCIDEALFFANSIKTRYGRKPVTTDFYEEFPLFVDSSNIDNYPEMAEIIKRQCGATYDMFIKNHKAIYNGLDSFLEAAGLE